MGCNKSERDLLQGLSRQTSNKVANSPAATNDFSELRTNIATFCALLFCLFGDGCDLYQSMLDICGILNNAFCSQNKAA